jgi:hypothetical protein
MMRRLCETILIKDCYWYVIAIVAMGCIEQGAAHYIEGGGVIMKHIIKFIHCRNNLMQL